MKSFIAALAIAAVIISGSIFYSIHLKNISEDMQSANTEIVSLIKSNSYEEAEKRIKQLSDFIEEKKVTLASTMDHTDLDKIELSLSELEEYVRGERSVDALARCNMLEVMFSHLPKNYRLRLENIL